MPRLGCLNIHASLLPRWRGAAPIQRAILAGDAETGITIMQMDSGLDTGAILLKTALPIAPDDTAGSLHDKLAQAGAARIVEALARPDTLTPFAQDNTLATYAAKLTREEARLDWTRPADELARAVHGYNPVPGAHTLWHGSGVKIWQAAVQAEDRGQGTGDRKNPQLSCDKTSVSSPLSSVLCPLIGEVLVADAHGIVVACGRDALRLTELQMSGGKRMAAAAFIAGHGLRPGSFFGH
jgi:methionyl-tRNA formyltransferase